MSGTSDSKPKTNLVLKATREGFSEGLIEAAKQNDKVYAVCADLAASVGMQKFSEQFPERFVEVGVAEQNLVTVASGLAIGGKIPFAASFAMFNPGRNWEQIRTTVCYNNQPVKIVGSHAGLGVGEDGASHQALEDIAIMRVIPNIDIVVPCDAIQAKKATVALAKTNRPAYLRIFRQKTPLLTDETTPFEIGKIQILKQSGAKNDVCIIASGPIISNALEAANTLGKYGVSCSVLNCHTIKPLDEKTLLSCTANVKFIAVVEDHQIAGGLGGAIAELLSAKQPRKMLFIGVKDEFGESGSDAELYAKHRLDSAGISKTISEALQAGNLIVKRKRTVKRSLAKKKILLVKRRK